MSGRPPARPRVGFLLGEPTGGVESVWIRLSGELRARGWDVVPILVGRDTIAALQEPLRAAACSEFELLPGALDLLDGRVLGEHVLRLGLDVYVPNYTNQAHEVMTVPGCPPAVVTVQGSHPEFLAEIRPFLPMAAAVIVVAPNLVERVRPWVGRSRLHLVTNGVPLGAPREDAERRRLAVPGLIHVGRLETEVKRAERYLALDEALARHGRPYRFTVVGGGEWLDAFQQRARQAPSRVLAPGPVPAAAVPRYLDANDLFVLLSDSEGMSIALLEAMARGLVPIVSAGAVRQCGTVTDGVNGIVVDPADLADVAARIHALAAAPEVRSRLGQAARATAEVHGLGQMAAKYDRILRQASEARLVPSACSEMR